MNKSVESEFAIHSSPDIFFFHFFISGGDDTFHSVLEGMKQQNIWRRAQLKDGGSKAMSQGQDDMRQGLRARLS